MKNICLICIFLAFTSRALAQIPTSGLLIQYDMVTISGGTTLTDSSGNSNNGILHGPTANAKGLIFDGVNDYVTIPAVVKNSDFTAIIVKTGDTNPGSLWYEGDDAQDRYMRVFNATTGSSARLNSSGGDSGVFGPVMPAWSLEYHSVYLQRSGNIAVTGMIEAPYRAAKSLTGTPNFSADTCAAIGSQIYGTSCVSQNLFFGGTIAYFLLYSRALSPDEMDAAYLGIKAAIAGRSVFLEDIVRPIQAGQIWNRQGSILAGQEPSAMYETTNCQIVANPCFKLWYSSGTDVGYAESLDALNWSVHAAVISSKHRPSVVKVGSTYYAYVEASDTSISRYSSSDGITWTLDQAGVLTVGGAGTWDATSINNPFAMKEGSTWYLAYEATGAGHGGDSCGYATSSDGLSFTKATANPITGGAQIAGHACQGPVLYHAASGKWFLWGGVLSSIGTNRSVGRFQSTTPNDLWAVSVPFVTYPPTGFNDEISAGDPSLVEANGKTYLFYGATPSSGTASIKLAIANAPLSQVVLTSEGAISNAP